MPSIMIERVARAIYEAQDHEYDFDSFDADSQIQFRKEASAAISAMREPTNIMMAEAEGEVIELATFAEKENSPSYKAWQAMIDAALKEDN